ncbi:putative phage replication protein RstA [Beggiatoa alba B18LD]|uniref:Putative phage replication protein RstA n=1 Tax=Beggiatoa alba B18LD TaxID=395493 RepID=I3CE15_9GAMM|nr:replication initiation factor domain-containing protein [Beggiatoa alba]EIJ41858.1 putative phage replication protein RstA [Beggiatoa alba B18LD]
MSGDFGAQVDYLSLSFDADNLGGVHASGFLEFILDALRLAGVAFIADKRPAGIYGYERSYILNRVVLGGVSSSGLIAYTDSTSSKKNKGFYLSLSGLACLGLDVKAFIKQIQVFEPHITRIDLAVDYLDGLVNYDYVKQAYFSGLFNSGGREPRHNVIEPKVHGEKVGGYTLYVGKRGGAKFCRAYEKNYQLLDEAVDNPFPHWFRLEIEARSVDCDIPLALFDDYNAFLLGFYPRLFSQLPTPSHVVPSDVSGVPLKLSFDSPQTQVNLAHLKHYARQSYGGLLNVMKHHLKLTDEEIVKSLLPSDKRVPRRLQLPIEA